MAWFTSGIRTFEYVYYLEWREKQNMKMIKIAFS